MPSSTTSRGKRGLSLAVTRNMNGRWRGTSFLLVVLAAGPATSCCEPGLVKLMEPFEERFSDARIRARFQRQRAAFERLREATLADDVISLGPGSIARRNHSLRCSSRVRSRRFPWICTTPTGERPARDFAAVGQAVGLPGDRVKSYVGQLNALHAKYASWNKADQWIVYITGQSGHWSKQIVWSRRPPGRIEADSLDRPDLMQVSSRLSGDWYIRRTGTFSN
jgi:hypothetical protein